MTIERGPGDTPLHPQVYGDRASFAYAFSFFRKSRFTLKTFFSGEH
jgi:hypothetical protein